MVCTPSVSPKSLPPSLAYCSRLLFRLYTLQESARPGHAATCCWREPPIACEEWASQRFSRGYIGRVVCSHVLPKLVGPAHEAHRIGVGSIPAIVGRLAGDAHSVHSSAVPGHRESPTTSAESPTRPRRNVDPGHGGGVPNRAQWFSMSDRASDPLGQAKREVEGVRIEVEAEIRSGSRIPKGSDGSTSPL
jgi:hypothetical protein